MNGEEQAHLDGWAQQIFKGDAGAVARAISAMEDGGARARELMHRLFPHTGRAILVGITGPSGSGKSTLADRLAAALRKRGCTVGILAVDPTSPFSGGAVLGDRVRMQNLAGDPGVFIRSLATRGASGGLSSATLDAAMVLDAAGNDFILVETVGTGQDEVEIAQLADAVLLLLVPFLGDEVQAFKAGIMEIADLFVINKSDIPGADRLEEQLESLLELAPSEEDRWRPPILRTIATDGAGTEEVLNALGRFLEFAHRTGSFQRRRISGWKWRIGEQLRRQWLDALRSPALSNGLLDRLAAAVESRSQDPYGAAEELWNEAYASEPRS